MIKIILNGNDEQIETGITVQKLLERFEVPEAGTAVAINGEITPREDFGTKAIENDDCVDILRAIGGG